MYASLRFPSPPTDEAEYTLPGDFSRILEGFSLSDSTREILMRSLGRACFEGEVLAYRAQVAGELFSSEALREAFCALSALRQGISASVPSREVDRLRTVARFEGFVARFDAFCKGLDGLVPESEGAKRCFRFLRSYAESYAYKELRYRAGELIQSFRFDQGACLALGAPGPEGTARLFRNDDGGSLHGTVRSLMDRFGLPACEEEPAPPREYSDTEAAVLTGIIRGNGEIHRRMEAFFALYEQSGTGEILRLSEEASLLLALDELYRAGRRMGYEVCCPQFREAGFYSEISGLCYGGGEDRADFIATPLNHITVVCGPDSSSYLDAVALAHVCASAGGLVFARQAEISPIDRLERDKKDQICTSGLNENSLCLCGNLFDAMLPRQEEAAADEVIRRLSECTVRSVVRLCAKSNPAALQKQIEAGSLPPCTFLQAGTDRTLEDLLKRHNLTAEELEGEDRD